MTKRAILQGFLVIAILVGAAWGGWQIWQMEPPTAGEEHEHEHEHGHGGNEEGGKHEGHEGGHEHGHEEEGGHVRLTPEQRQNAGITVAEAGPARIRTTLPLYGKIEVNQDGMAHVVPRFPGVLKEVRKRLGDKVEKGETLALVESNESLRVYEIKADLEGTVIEKDATRGEFVRDDKTIFTVADVSSVWVDFSVFRQDFHLLKIGQPVTVRFGGESIEAAVDYISPFGAESTQTMLARCTIPNPHGDLRPGLFVTAEVQTGEIAAEVAVPVGAVQMLKEKPVVFVEEGEEFEVREVALGAADAERVQVLGGLKAGEKFVAANSFILKAEIGKGEAAHEH